MIKLIQLHVGGINGRGFVDSAPVLEKSWAQKAGLGWVGKNGNLINKETGSFFFIATLIVDIELKYDDDYAKDYCGTCTRCIDACPTDAITEPYVVDGSKCISYFTIELKEKIPDEVKGKFNDWIFGCDICQDVCPWNSFSKPHAEPLFAIKNEIEKFLCLSNNATGEQRGFVLLFLFFLFNALAKTLFGSCQGIVGEMMI